MGQDEVTNQDSTAPEKVSVKNGLAKKIYSKRILHRKPDILPRLVSVEELIFNLAKEPANEQTDLDEDAKMLATVLLLVFPIKTIAKLKSLLPDS